MKREIKFRAWDEQWGVMYNNFQFYKTGDLQNDWIVFTCDGVTFEDNWKDNPFFRCQIYIMQYTGLKDKNGKEIYEGDIVKGKESGYDGIRINGWDGYRVGSVIFDSLLAWAYAINGQSHQMLVYLKDIEVIGNIYENTELLKK